MNETCDLASEKCEPCQGGTPPMSVSEALKMLPNLNEGWALNSGGHLERVFLLKNFSEAIKLAVKFGVIADQVGHHPDLLVSYGKLKAEIWTHKIGGLSRADFVLAAKFDQVD